MWQCERRKEMSRVSLPSSVGDRRLTICHRATISWRGSIRTGTGTILFRPGTGWSGKGASWIVHEDTGGNRPIATWASEGEYTRGASCPATHLVLVNDNRCFVPLCPSPECCIFGLKSIRAREPWQCSTFDSNLTPFSGLRPYP